MSEFAFTTTTGSTARFHDTVSMTQIDQLLGGIETSRSEAMTAVAHEEIMHHYNQLDAKVIALAEELIRQMYEHLPLEARRQLINAKSVATTHLSSMRMHLEQDTAVGTTLPSK